MQRVEVGDAVDADDMAAARRRMGAHARVAPRAELLAARIRIDLELAAQASFRAVFMSDMGINLVVLAVRRSLPVYPDKQTI